MLAIIDDGGYFFQLYIFDVGVAIVIVDLLQDI
jgi:hypothetical protein